MPASLSHVATGLIAVFVIGGVLIRPWHLPEALFATLGAVILVLASLISLADAGAAVWQGADVYCFLTGMMLLAELARHEALFDWLAAHAVEKARGSAARLFTLIYGVGIVVTVCLSNDATAVVLTPAVYAAAKRANADPLPYLFICAFIANAASFVLPISNPANLVVFGAHMPALRSWLGQFGWASSAAILITYLVLRITQRNKLRAVIARDVEVPTLTPGGRLAAVGIAATAIVLLVASSLDWQLGLPTLLAGLLTTVAVLIHGRIAPWTIGKEISWGVIPLVAGLFVLVRAVENTGLLRPLLEILPGTMATAPTLTAWTLGTAVAMLCNIFNNLPLGLIAGSIASGAHLSAQATGALLIGVDLGPNLSVTGSLATILWLVALRREGQTVSARNFLILGAFVMPPALIAALAAYIGLPLAHQ